MFVQLHLLTSYPPSNLNRDDMGRPKTATMGGVPRLRVSSQSLKRAWRTSSVFAERLEGALSLRTRRLALEVRKSLLDKGADAKLADAAATAIGAAVYGEVDPGKDFRAGQLAFIGPAERAAVDALVERVAASGKPPAAEEAMAVVLEQPKGADLALFGRMLASRPSFNVEAAAEVAHALTVHRAEVEDDYFTAVDDLQAPGEDEGAGAGFVGETGFGAGLFYLYVCIDMDLLARNLGGDTELARAAAQALAQAAATVGPSGKRASFASRAYASYVLAERGDALPRSLSVAFLSPAQEKAREMLSAAVAALQGTAEKMDRAYGATASARYRMDVEAGIGDMSGLLAFVAGEPGNLSVAST